jgi:hypothetical protein
MKKFPWNDKLGLVLFCILAFSGIWETSVAADFSLNPPPPIKKVTFYKHGVGYFERLGKVTGNVRVVIGFKVDQMKDLLKSFFAVDLGGGKVDSVKFDSKDATEKRLKDISIRVDENQALSNFLKKLKGNKVSLKIGGERISGQILGIEPLDEIFEEKGMKMGFRLVLLTNEDQLKTANLDSVTEIQLEDEALKRELREYLDISKDRKSTELKKVNIEFSGEKEREIKIGYLVEMPIWKCSYRIIFDGEASNPYLQGWALAENTTGENWENVEISFVAGNPLSYILDLYTPSYLKRTEIPLPGLNQFQANWDAVPETGNLVTKSDMQSLEKLTVEFADELALLGVKMTAMEDAFAGSGTANVSGSSETKAFNPLLNAIKSKKVGELFCYKCLQPISISKDSTAMIPIISRKINGKKILYFKSQFSSKPSNAFVLNNDTELTFDTGAIAFFEGETSLGEGLLAHTLAPGGKEILPYAIDSGVDVIPQITRKSDPSSSGFVKNGILEMRNFDTITHSWMLINRTKHDVTLWLDQPKNPNYELSKPASPSEDVGNCYRFEIPIKSGENKIFLVEEKKEVFQAFTLSDCSPEKIRLFVSQSYFSDETKSFLRRISEIASLSSSLHTQLEESQKEITSLSDEQERLRKNLESLRTDIPKELELRGKWIESLSSSEIEIKKSQGKISELNAELKRQKEILSREISDFQEAKH